jgi:hypothetical protein
LPVLRFRLGGIVVQRRRFGSKGFALLVRYQGDRIPNVYAMPPANLVS